MYKKSVIVALACILALGFSGCSALNRYRRIIIASIGRIRVEGRGFFFEMDKLFLEWREWGLVFGVLGILPPKGIIPR